ncbi:hypothetical protein GA254_17875 [Escherichia coli]|uniref:Uncharacterized protein n=3 Tax=Escherichia coli TaxID=562 RepID=A0A5P0J7D7_ECOLX|nr:hypothetical protein [Escherichia coli]EEW2491089.1 hypothetical protein [Escherichia coli]EFH5682526.1 hypothetical protein [Escherichia coli]EFH9448504.1 hypothetical protein [Escherichia coli]EFJ3057326.1 hypothetical protein [Escherichia coli]EFN3271196.1 hypothetical protein [Escherichia coli]
MTTLTKEQLISHERESVSYLEDLKGRVSKEGADCKVVIEMVARDLKLARIALASLEAKPIGAFHIAEQQVDGTSDYLKDGEWPIDNGTIEVYAAPPVPVVPEEKPMPNALSMLEREITQLIGDAQEATVTGYELIAEAWRLMDGQDPKTSDWHSKASKYLNSNIVEKVDDDRIEAVKAVLRRLAGNHPDFPDSSQQSPKKSVKTTLERGYLEAALKIKPGHTLGVIDAMLVHEMAKALLPLVADKIPNKADI